VNALIHLRSGLTTVNNEVGDLDLYVTDSPCEACFNLIAASGKVKRIFFGTPYRKTDHLHRRQRKYMDIYRVLPAGYVIDWRTKELVDVET
jgi:deoxycytidylate deaminase